jgi:hypothetical protein
MHYLPPTSLPHFTHLHSVYLNGIAASSTPHGTGLVHTLPHDPNLPLLSIHTTLAICPSTVLSAAKSDHFLHTLLTTLSSYPWACTPRGTVLIYLLLRLHPATTGVRDAWSDYSSFLPHHTPLPTSWSSQTRALLSGTSIFRAVDQKLRTLSAEFASAKPMFPNLTLQDWIHGDELFRSRSLEIPGLGASMLPVLDLVNHSTSTTARYEVSGDGMVELWPTRELRDGEEVMIDYSGGCKGAGEMLFSYGFIDDDATAGVVMLDLPPAGDDPLGKVKETVWKGSRTVRVYEREEEAVSWESEFIWLAIMNEEDGLEFSVLQENDGGMRLKVEFKAKELDFDNSSGMLREMLREEELWDVYQLRAVATVKGRVEEQLHALLVAEAAQEDEEVEAAEAGGADDGKEAGKDDPQASELALKLRGLEKTLMMRSVEALGREVPVILVCTLIPLTNIHRNKPSLGHRSSRSTCAVCRPNLLPQLMTTHPLRQETMGKSIYRDFPCLPPLCKVIIMDF